MRITRRSRSFLVVVLGVALFSCVRRMPTSGLARAPIPRPSAGAPPAAAAKVVTAPGPRMNHAKHLAKGLECADCHLKAGDDEKEKVVEPRAITYAAVCAECHDDEDKALPDEKKVKNAFFTAQGAPKWTRALRAYAPEVKWAHAPHGKVECTACHGDLDVVPRVVRPAFDMAGCIQCHAKRGAKNECATCHAQIRGDVPPPSHAAGWRKAHGGAASASTASCMLCHRDPGYCDRCHQKTAPESHASGWREQHGSFATQGAQRCEMCHVDPNQCVSCHLATKPASHEHLWRERHGAAALFAHGRNEGRCEMCHLDPGFCQRCHAVEEPRNHTQLFRTRTHGILASIDRTKCQVCHETDFCIRCHENTPPRSHRGLWASGPNLHCVQCHFPIAFEGSCRACHFEEPRHETAPDQPAWHVPGMNCRQCHTPAGNGAPPLRHLDNGTQCEKCHR